MSEAYKTAIEIVVRIPTVLRKFVGGRASVDANGANVLEVIMGLAESYPQLSPVVVDRSDIDNVRIPDRFMGRRWEDARYRCRSGRQRQARAAGTPVQDFT